VTDPEQAVAGGAAVLTEAAPDNIAAEMRYGDAAATEAAFARAAHKVSLTVDNQRVIALPIEPRSVLAWVAEDGRLTLRMSTQMPSGVRNSLCNDIFGWPRESVRVTVGDVGGGFGMKTGIYPEDAAVAWCARTLKRPGEVDRRPQRGIPELGARPRPARAGRAGAGSGWPHPGAAAAHAGQRRAPTPPAPVW
jgi:carbon-monoxide dehydrogenase large subunit